MTPRTANEPTPAPAPPPEISAVVPVYNEVGALPDLYRELTDGLARTKRAYEIWFVDDGSTDGSAERLDTFAAKDPRVNVIHFRKNFGKSPALAAAFERVQGQIIVTLDADLQDDPAMIPEFVERIELGADLVSGWKQRRLDPPGKTLPSKFFNFIVRTVSGVALRDFNCGFKAYRIECIRELSVYGGFHRFLPVLAGERGFRVEELVVNHRPRTHGVSKFGVMRFFEGFLDLLTVLMVTRFRTRPVHFFGILGTISGVVGGLILLYLSILWLFDNPIGHRPLLLLGVLLALAAVQFIGVGLLGELLVRTTISSREIFSVRSIVTGAAATPALAAGTDQAARQSLGGAHEPLPAAREPAAGDRDPLAAARERLAAGRESVAPAREPLAAARERLNAARDRAATPAALPQTPSAPADPRAKTISEAPTVGRLPAPRMFGTRPKDGPHRP